MGCEVINSFSGEERWRPSFISYHGIGQLGCQTLPKITIMKAQLSKSEMHPSLVLMRMYKVAEFLHGNIHTLHCGATIQDRELQQRPNTIKFESIFNLIMLLTILNVSNYQQLQE